MDELGQEALNRNLLFDESTTLSLNIDYLRRELSNLKVSKVEIAIKEILEDPEDSKRAENAVPGVPVYRIV